MTTCTVLRCGDVSCLHVVKTLLLWLVDPTLLQQLRLSDGRSRAGFLSLLHLSACSVRCNNPCCSSTAHAAAHPRGRTLAHHLARAVRTWKLYTMEAAWREHVRHKCYMLRHWALSTIYRLAVSLSQYLILPRCTAIQTTPRVIAVTSVRRQATSEEAPTTASSVLYEQSRIVL